MQINVNRQVPGDKCTIGTLSTDSGFTCFTLEDIDRGLRQTDSVQDIIRQKVLFPKSVAIPSGTYEIVMTYSERFKKVMPQLMNVPGFNGIRIHNGNTQADTEGCLLVGTLSLTIDTISESKTAFGKLYAILQEACAKEKVWITINSAI